MHILHSLFTNDLGGTERYVADLANEQLQQGHQVSVLLRGKRQLHGLADAFLQWLKPGVQVVSLPRHFMWRRWPLLPIWWKVKQLKPDIIHTHHGRDSRYLAKVAGDIPVVASLHMRFREKDYKRHDGIICVSNWQLETIPEKMRDQAVLIPNWVRHHEPYGEQKRQQLRNSLGIDDQTILYGYVGRLSPEKAPLMLIEAFIGAAVTKSHLAMFGGGELASQCEAAVSGAENITIMGYEPDIWPWYEAFDVFVLPSREESFGLVLLEAMDAQCPIITTRTLGALDLLSQNDEVLMTEVASPLNMAQALKQMADRPKKRVNYSELEVHRLEGASQAIMQFYRQYL